jgi:hypothetical protein
LLFVEVLIYRQDIGLVKDLLDFAEILTSKDTVTCGYYHSDYRTVSPYLRLLVYVELIQAVLAHD